MRRLILGLAAGAVLAPGPATAQFSLAPDWAERPGPEDLSPHYPKLPQHLLIEGNALVRCEVAVNGVLERCVVEHESPKGLGFGEAALAMSRSFDMRPALRPGARQPDNTVRVPINFRLPPASAAPPRPSLDAERSALAEALAAAADPTRAGLAHIRREAERLKASPGRGVDKVMAADAATALVAAAERFAPEFRRDVVATVASRTEPGEITGFIAFARSPVGQRYFADRPERLAAASALQRDFMRRQRSEARAVLCAEIACDVKSTDVVSPLPRDDQAEYAPPRWRRYPSSAEKRAAWPFGDLFGVPLVAFLTCAVGPQGAPDDCKALGATPRGLGAERAALALAREYRMDDDALKAGAAGKRAILPVMVFGGSAPKPQPVAAKAGGRTLELAKQIFDARTGGKPPPDLGREELDKLLGDVDPAARATAERALAEGRRRAAEAYRLGWADLLAAEFTEPELKQILAFHRGPGAAVSKAQEGQRETLTALAVALGDRVAGAARETFCAKYDCREEKPPEPKGG